VNDLLLWRALGGPAPLADELLPLLEELATRPPEVRMPFAGRLLRAARDERPRVRAAALASLTGYEGREALCGIVRGLDDTDTGVAAGAVEALRAVADSDLWRLAHALFHPDPAIRRAMLTGRLAAAAALFLPYLLADEACVQEVLPLVAGAVDLPGFALDPILDRLAADQLSPEAAADLVGRIRPADLVRWIASAGLEAAATAHSPGPWPPDRIGDLLERLGRRPRRGRPPFLPKADRLPEWLPLLQSAPPDGRGSLLERLLRALHDVQDPLVRQGVAAAVTARLLATPAPTDGDQDPAHDTAVLVRLLVAAWPAAALWRWVDRGCRRAAAQDFLTIPVEQLALEPFGPLGDVWLESVANSDLVRDPSGAGLDLRTLAGVGRLVGLDALDRILDHFRHDELAAGLLWPTAAAFLSVPGSSEKRARLVVRALGDDRTNWPRRLAHLVPAFNQELLPLLADLTPAETLELLRILQWLEPAGHFKDPRGRRLRSVAEALGRLLAGVPLPAAKGGVRTISSGPRPGHFVLETGPHVGQGPPPADPPPGSLGERLCDFVLQWRDGLHEDLVDAFLRQVFLAAIESLPDETAAARLESLDAESLRFLLLEQFRDDAIPSGLDAALRQALADRERPPARSLAATLASAGGGILQGLNRAWAALLGRRPAEDGAAAEPPAVVEPPPTSTMHTLTVVERCRLLDSEPARMSRLLWPWSYRSTRGLAECLARRQAPQPRGVEASMAILLCHDPLFEIDRALATFLPIVPSVMGDRLDSLLAARHTGDERLTFPLHAWLWRWERHLEQGIAILADTDRPLATVVADAAGLSCRLLAVRLLEFVRAVLERCGFRDREAFHRHATDALAEATAAALGGRAGPAAAAVLVSWNSRDPRSESLARARLRVVAMLPDLSHEVRAVLEPWVSSRGLECESSLDGGGMSLREAFEDCLAHGAPLPPAVAERAVACVVDEQGPSWFLPGDWNRLVAAGIEERWLARRLAVARQPHAYSIALETLLTEPAPSDEDCIAVAAFLDQGDTRLADLRLPAARLLFDRGNPVGLPLLLAAETDDDPRTPRLFAGLDTETVADAVRSALAAEGIRESVLAELLLEPTVTVEARAAGLQVLLVEGVSDTVRDRILPRLARSRTGSERIRRVAESFAWGIRRGLELTGRLFTVQMIAGEDLGYTRLDQPRVFVNPLPVLRGERFGEAIVRGLVIHEVGHHVYHADPENLAAAAAAREEGFFPLLNLVQDEHLERNLRAIDPAMGDPLKRLAAYGFQHAPRERLVPNLLETLGSRAFPVLTSVRLSVARHAGHVVVQAGRVLRQLEKRGGSFPRFVRALRMGLGGRGADAKTTEALALFGPGFRHSDGGRLLAIARELRRIFGEEARLLELLGGLATPVAGAAGDPTRDGEGLTDRELQQEVERVLAPPSRAGGTGRRTKGRRLQINVAPDEEFSRITTIEPVPFDPARSAVYRRRVARPAAQLRRFFERLGLAHQLDRQRLQGRLLDRGRLLALAIRGEPRVMVSRRLVPSTDLFLGVAVDCSGSMADGDNIEKARLFAELLAESVRGCRGIDLAVCGFNDSTIFDAGSATRCAAHALDEGGGNNDAAGLWHLAEVALASRRRARLLVMISDGLPTECSVAALRKLVQVLTHRYGMCCAQVAVRPLEEECFPIHVRLEADDLAGAVAAFGRTVMRLVQRAVGAGG